MISIPVFSEFYKLPYPTVSKILKNLAKEGIVASIQGSKGGYRLVKKADEINLKMLIDIFDGNSNIVSCLADKENNTCCYFSECTARSIMSTVDDEISKIFEGITIEKLLSKGNKLTV